MVTPCEVPSHHDEEKEEIVEAPAAAPISEVKEKTIYRSYFYYVYGGNYPETVIKQLAARGNWVQCRETESIEKCHFLWRPVNYNIDGYKRMDRRFQTKGQVLIYNHFEVLKGLTTKTGLIRSLKQYYYSSDSASKYIKI